MPARIRLTSHFLLLMTACGLAATALSCNKGGNGKPSIAVIPKGTTHAYWSAVRAGAQKAGDELGYNIIWKGPPTEDDKTGQIGIVDDFVTGGGITGICLAPLDETALLPPVQAAAQKKIPVVIFDSALKGQAGKDFASLVATDNKKAGEMGGEELARLLGGKGKVVLFRYKEGHASTGDREAGFLEAMSRHKDIQVISRNRYAGATAGEAQTAAMNMGDTLKDADGVFAPNESSTEGLLHALADLGLARKIKFVGFDATPALLDALRSGDVQALVAQDPQKMGYLAVSTLIKVAHGEKAPDYIDTGSALVTKENLSDPAIKKITGQ